MHLHRILVIAVFLQLMCLIYGFKPVETVDDIKIRLFRHQDSLTISLITNVPKYQLSFLMQGLHVSLSDTAHNPVVRVEFPNARIVRDKIKHHPNEVRAMHETIGDEVRPDLLPLISALNDTCSKTNSFDNQTTSCTHSIALDKTKREMTFAARILLSSSILLHDSILVEILSSPMDMKSEFEGRRLSLENRMPPGGMGQPPKENNDQNRIIHISKKVCIESSND